MSYTLRVHVREAEPYTGLDDYDEVRAAVEEEARNTVNELGSDILETGSEEERDSVTENLTNTAMKQLWRKSKPGEDRVEHRLPGGLSQRTRGVLLSLTEEDD